MSVVGGRICVSLVAIVSFVAGWLPADAALAETIYASADGQLGFYYDPSSSTFVPVERPQRLETVLQDLSGSAIQPKPLRENTIVQLLIGSTAAKQPVLDRPTTYRSTATGCRYEISHLESDPGITLLVRGVRYQGQWLTEFSGPSVPDVIANRHACKAGRLQPRVAAELRAEMPEDGTQSKGRIIDQLLIAEAEKAALMRATGSIKSIGEQGSLIRCLSVDSSSGVQFEGLSFRNCWLPAIYVVDSAEISVKDSLFVGSSYAVIAIASGRPEVVHGFTIEGNVWIADESGYDGAENPDDPGCKNLHGDLVQADCPGVIWSKVPWGGTHDTFYEHMNGALFGAIDSIGGVTFKNNIVRNAYNGVRMTASKECRKETGDEKKGCLAKINQNVVIAGNRFAFIRDNPIEPERRAVNWRIYDNVFFNSHAWISTDGVAGGPIYVWGNVGWFNDVPATKCDNAYRDPTWKPGWTWQSPRRVDFVNGGYTKTGKPEPDFAYTCQASLFGTVVKVGDEAADLSKHLYLFHNSWYIKTPIIRGGSTGVVHHWNNAIELVGCGAGPDKDPLCRVYPTTPAEFQDPNECKGFADFWTVSAKSLFAKCISEREFKSATQYDFRHDIVSQGFPPCCLPAEEHVERAPGFESGASGKFKTLTEATAGKGCIVTPILANDHVVGLACKGTGADVGKFDRKGNPYAPPPELLRSP